MTNVQFAQLVQSDVERLSNPSRRVHHVSVRDMNGEYQDYVLLADSEEAAMYKVFDALEYKACTLWCGETELHTSNMS